jgi:hypothetical protein
VQSLGLNKVLLSIHTRNLSARYNAQTGAPGLLLAKIFKGLNEEGRRPRAEPRHW